MKDSMNEYIIYTPEGLTIAPNENYLVENCQVLGCAMGNNTTDAVANLLTENQWIIKAGFVKDKFIIRQLV